MPFPTTTTLIIFALIKYYDANISIYTYVNTYFKFFFESIEKFYKNPFDINTILQNTVNSPKQQTRLKTYNYLLKKHLQSHT